LNLGIAYAKRDLCVFPFFSVKEVERQETLVSYVAISRRNRWAIRA